MRVVTVAVGPGFRHHVLTPDLKWEYVAKLARKASTYNLDFTVITDEPWDHLVDMQGEEPGFPGWYQKLSLFNPGRWRHSEVLLFIDLDAVVCGDLNNLAMPIHACAKAHNKWPINTSVMVWPAGSRRSRKIYEAYKRQPPNRDIGDGEFMLSVDEPWPTPWPHAYFPRIKRNDAVTGQAVLGFFHGPGKPHQMRDHPFVKKFWT